MLSFTLRELRKSKGLRQPDLASLAAVQQSTISRMESGERAVSEGAAKRLAHVLEVDADLLRLATSARYYDRRARIGELNPEEPTKIARTLMERFDREEESLDEAQQIAILGIGQEYIRIVEVAYSTRRELLEREVDALRTRFEESRLEVAQV